MCRLYVQWRFMRGIEAQFLALQKGFNELIPQHLLRPFDERELEVWPSFVACSNSHFAYALCPKKAQGLICCSLAKT